LTLSLDGTVIELGKSQSLQEEELCKLSIELLSLCDVATTESDSQAAAAAAAAAAGGGGVICDAA